jgi:hypothetical protein
VYPEPSAAVWKTCPVARAHRLVGLDALGDQAQAEHLRACSPEPGRPLGGCKASPGVRHLCLCLCQCISCLVSHDDVSSDESHMMLDTASSIGGRARRRRPGRGSSCAQYGWNL